MTSSDLSVLSSSRTASNRRSRPWLVLAAICAFAMTGACSGDDPVDDEPVCGDGKVGGNEVCDGSDFGGVTCGDNGFDEGALSCSNDCKTVDTAACVVLDADADGLNIYDEETAGTDPNNPDSDADGFLDGEEFHNGADPLSINSWPTGLGKWPNRKSFADADAVSGNGWLVGDVMNNFNMTDQFGNNVELHQFYGYKLMISFGAVWCGPCREAAKNSEVLWSEHVQDGVIFLEVLLENNSFGPAAQTDVDDWAAQYAITYPVAYGPSFGGFNKPDTSSIPSYYSLNSDLTVAETQAGFGGDAALSTAVDALY